VKTDTALGRATWFAGIRPHPATLAGVLVIVALACGFAVVFALLVQDIAIRASCYGVATALGAETPPILQTYAALDGSRDRRTSLWLPHVVDRWYDEPAAFD